MHFNFIRYSKIYYIFSGLLALTAIFCLLIFRLNFGIDFSGGSILEVEFEKRPENSVIQEKLKNLNLGEIILQPAGDRGMIIRMKEVDETTHQKIISQLAEISKTEELQFESIGPAIGKELRQKTVILIIISLAALLCYIAIAFRKLTWPVSGFEYGVISIIALFFDVLITIGAISLLGKFGNVQFNIMIITALLTILGYTINDKVVVFDRVRENLLKTRGEDFTNLLNQSLNQIFIRSISTGTCALLVLFSIFFFGGETLKYFSLTLIIGIIVGTYSSLFLASPLLVNLKNRKGKRIGK